METRCNYVSGLAAYHNRYLHILLKCLVNRTVEFFIFQPIELLKFTLVSSQSRRAASNGDTPQSVTRSLFVSCIRFLLLHDEMSSSFSLLEE